MNPDPEHCYLMVKKAYDHVDVGSFTVQYKMVHIEQENCLEQINESGRNRQENRQNIKKLIGTIFQHKLIHTNIKSFHHSRHCT
jgi:hypothetical protein